MTKQQIISELIQIRQQAETHDNAAIRADMVEAIDKLTSAIEAMPEPETVDVEWLAEDYRTTRQFILDERKMRVQVFRERPQALRRKTGECDTAGQALNRLAAALGIETPALAARVPQMQQAPLIERGKVEVMA